MKKYFVTFGSNHLNDYNINSMSVMLIIQGENYIEARHNLGTDEELNIGNRFAFQYEMDQADDMTSKFGMRLYTKEELLTFKKKDTKMTNIEKLDELGSALKLLIDQIRQKLRDELGIPNLLITYHDHYPELRLSIWDASTMATTVSSYYVMGKGFVTKGAFTEEQLTIMEDCLNGTV